MRRCDVLIVGAGPSGSTAAFILAKMGLDVLLIDKVAFPRRKTCGGLLTYKTIELLRRVFGIDLSELVLSGVVNYATGDFRVLLNGYPVGDFSSYCPFFFTDRYVYDDFLRLRAMDEGARFSVERLTDIDGIRHVAHTSLGEIAYGFLIGADGVSSTVRRRAGGGISRRYGVCLECYGARADKPMLFFGDVRRGYSWVFPNGSVGSIACGGERDVFVAFDRVSGFCRSGPRGWYVSFGSHADKVALGSVFLIGDAGMFADGLLAEGIYYAHKTAEIVSMAIVGGRKPEEAYKDGLRSEVYPRLRLLKGLSRFVYEYRDLFPVNIKRLLLGALSHPLTRFIGCP